MPPINSPAASPSPVINPKDICGCKILGFIKKVDPTSIADLTQLGREVFDMNKQLSDAFPNCKGPEPTITPPPAPTH